MRYTHTLLFAVGMALLSGQPILADDFIQQAIPQKWISPLVPEALPKLDYPAYFKDLDKAKMEAFSGRYKLSLLTLAKVKDGDPLQVALVKATSLSAIGQKEAAIKVLSDPKIIGNPRAAILRAQILSDLCQPAEAIKVLKKVLEKDKNSVAAHYWLGAIAETAGDMELAKQSYGFFEQYVDKLHAQQFEDAEELTLIGRGMDRWATINQQYARLGELNNLILTKTFGQVFIKVDREYWPAKVAAAEFNLARDDQKTAGELLMAVLKQNPNEVHTLTLLGQVALSQFNFDGAEKAIASLRKIDSTSVEADILETRNLLGQRRPGDAHKVILRVLNRQPRNIEALGLVAAVYALQLKEKEMKAALADVEKIDPHNATAYYEVAEQLAAMRQYPRAAEQFKVAIERAPWWSAAKNGLGLLYTQSGDEEEAYKILEQARLLDPFNFATRNYLVLLDDFRKFDKKETAHFVIMYDKNTDPVIPLYFADYLESIYADVCGAFHHEPAVKTYIEVFPKHDAFSVRTTGSPWIGTVGASTGRVIAMVAPRKGKNTMGPYNWAQVLRHEFTHTVTLSATDNRIAHWMTEGLAVSEEKVPLRWEWVPMLYNAVKKKQLFTMENITWGFVRPKRPIDRQLAYAESFWICQYIYEKFGREKMLAMLAEFRKGKEQQEVFPKILGKSISEFQKDFFAWTDKQVATWGYDAETTKKYNDLVKEGQAMIEARQYKEAVPIWEKIVKLRPMDALPHQRLAGLYITKAVNQPEKAIPHLVRLHKVELHDNRWAKRIARLYRDQSQIDKALEYGIQAVYIDPYDTDAHELLASLYAKAGNSAGEQKEQRTMKLLEDWAKSGSKESEKATNPG